MHDGAIVSYETTLTGSNLQVVSRVLGLYSPFRDLSQGNAMHTAQYMDYGRMHV